MMRLAYLRWPQLRDKVHAARPTLLLLWLLQAACWALLRLEGPAWQAQAPHLRNAFPQVRDTAAGASATRCGC